MYISPQYKSVTELWLYWSPTFENEEKSLTVSERKLAVSQSSNLQSEERETVSEYLILGQKYIILLASMEVVCEVTTQ